MRRDVPVGDRGEVIRVEARDDQVRLANGTRWEQRLTREEAWRLAEALDEVATSSSHED